VDQLKPDRMRLIVLLLLIASSFARAQKNELPVISDEIPEMEKRSHSRLFDAARAAASTSSSANFDVTYYRCEWEVDPNVKAIAGKITTHYIMTSASAAISLDLADNLTVSSVTQRGTPLLFTHASNTVTVTFPAEVALGVRDSISISYHGVPSSASGSFEVTTHGSGPTLAPVLWTLSEPFGSREWWPCKNGLEDKADSVDVYITHPTIYTAASNGLFQIKTEIDGDRSVTYWKHRYPIASYLVCMAVSNYVVLEHSQNILGDQIAMQTFCYPESQTTFAAGAVEALEEIAFFSNLFEKYPFRKEKYGHVQWGWGGGMEHQTCSFMVNMGTELVAHELAHQWFGDKITCGNWEDIWLNEGFATHLASMYLEYEVPENTLKRRNAEIQFVTSQLGGSLKVQNPTNVNAIFNQRLSYYKGSHVLYMLRWILGDAVFLTAVKNYLADPALAYGFATTDLLKTHLETASGKDLTYFFNQWFTGEGHPSYQVEWFPDNNSVQIKLNQTTSHASVGFFRLPIPLLFRNAGTGEQKLVTLDHTASGQVFVENLGFEPNEVVFDPELWLITRNNTITKVTGPLPVVFSHFKSSCAGSDVRLEWATSEEVNADYFEIQKSGDAVSWAEIGRVHAAGISVTEENYSFTDISAGGRQGYYRIAEHDYDGKVQHTRIVASQCHDTVGARIQLTPNPVGDRLKFKVEKGENVLVTIYNAAGVIPDPRFSGFLVADQNDVDVSTLSSGLYILTLHSKDRKTTSSVRFLKK
jgi:hypothetical protein